jgi:hypothetical protein
MARKTKAIAKQVKVVKESSSEEESQDDGEIFSQSFRNRIEQFSTLSKEVLTIKAVQEGTNPNQEIKERRGRVSARVEETSSNILREELESLEEWIAQQQKELAQQVNRINDAYAENKKTLEATGSFTASEIEQLL